MQVTDEDVLLGILPFFHSFGYTVTIWMVLALRVKGVYHYNPLDARQVGKLCREHGATFMVATPTFLRSYLRRCDEDDFASLDVRGHRRRAIAARRGRRLRGEVQDPAARRLRLYRDRSGGVGQYSAQPLPRQHPAVHAKEGTVGRPIPGVSAKVVRPGDRRATVGRTSRVCCGSKAPTS